MTKPKPPKEVWFALLGDELVVWAGNELGARACALYRDKSLHWQYVRYILAPAKRKRSKRRSKK